MNVFDTIQEFIDRDVKSINRAIANAWNDDSGAVGTPEEAEAAVTEIRIVTVAGYTLYVFTASDPTWSVPAPLANAIEAWAGVIGGGGRGFVGSADEDLDYVTLPGGLGGTHGGYIVNPFDPLTLGATLAITIGTAASSAGTNGNPSSIVNGATTLSESVPGVSGIATPQGDVTAEAAPGNGGDGGSATGPINLATSFATAGRQGGSTTAAVGGAGGTASAGSGSGTAGNGSNGSAGRTDALPIRGGSGGGGGGGASRYSGSATGGNGGNGAFPGGAGGGGGAAMSNGTIYSQTGGTPGTAANGIAWILCR